MDECLAQAFGSQRIHSFGNRVFLVQMINALGQLHDRERVLTGYFRNHARDRDRNFKFVVLQHRDVVDGFFEFEFFFRRRSVTETQVETAIKFLQISLGDALSVQAKIAHGTEIQGLVAVAARTIGHLEKRIVDIVEQLLQELIELSLRALPHTVQDRRHICFGAVGRAQCYDLWLTQCLGIP